MPCHCNNRIFSFTAVCRFIFGLIFNQCHSFMCILAASNKSMPLIFMNFLVNSIFINDAKMKAPGKGVVGSTVSIGKLSPVALPNRTIVSQVDEPSLKKVSQFPQLDDSAALKYLTWHPPSPNRYHGRAFPISTFNSGNHMFARTRAHIKYKYILYQHELDIYFS